MITKLDNESSKRYQAICDYWRLGPGRNLNQLFEQYQKQDNPPCKTYNTLLRWSNEFDWENRIATQIEKEQSFLEDIYQEELVKNARRRYDVLNDMYELAIDLDIDNEMVSVAQATGLYRALLDAIAKTFDLDAPSKFALTDPTGKKAYMQDDVSELLKLANAVKQRPE